MKLKDIYNEVKLIPPNRILLKAYSDGHDYYFEVNSKKYYVYDWEINNKIYGVRFNINDDLISFLDSKKIKYEICVNKLVIDTKYFITPDLINEIKLIPHNRILLKKYNGDEPHLYPHLYLHLFYFEINKSPYIVNQWDLIDGENIEFEKKFYYLSKLKKFLDDKKIKYEIDDKNSILVNSKYFILPDKINEVKLISSKNFKYEIGDILYDKVYNSKIKILKIGTYEMYKDEINKYRVVHFTEDPNSKWYYVSFIHDDHDKKISSFEWLREKEIKI